MNETISITKRNLEAVLRMTVLGLPDSVISKFRKEGTVMVSEPPNGVCKTVSDDILKRIKAFEDDYNAVVYHVVHDYSNLGDMESYLYVSPYPEDWKTDMEGLKHDSVLAYVYNLTDPVCSEVGTIGVKRASAGGLVRIW